MGFLNKAFGTFGTVSKGFDALFGGKDEAAPTQEAAIATDPRFGVSGESLTALKKERKKKIGAAASAQAEQERVAKAMGSILTQKEESPSLLG